MHFRLEDLLIYNNIFQAIHWVKLNLNILSFMCDSDTLYTNVILPTTVNIED